MASGLVNPWGLAFLPGGRFLVTEKGGTMRIVQANGSRSAAISGVPAVDSVGQGGLLDVALAPDYATTQRIYWSFAERDANGANGLAVASGVLNESALSLSGVQVIYRQTPKVSGSSGHFGGRILFAPDGKLFVMMGDRQNGDQRGFAQDLARGNGKIARINPDGSAPADNPFVGQSGAQAALWALGIRNPQGAAIHPTTGELLINEHGPQGGDEVNRITRGANYGWPVRSYGCEYGATQGEACWIGGGTHAPTYVEPVTTWTPTSTAPSGMLIYSGNAIPEWRNKALVGGMQYGGTLWRVDIDQTAAIRCTVRGGLAVQNCGEVLFNNAKIGKRIRDVRQGPDGWVYLLTDASNGEILRISR